MPWIVERRGLRDALGAEGFPVSGPGCSVGDTAGLLERGEDMVPAYYILFARLSPY